MERLLESWKRFMNEEERKDSEEVVKIVLHKDGKFLGLENEHDTFDLPGGHLHVGEEELKGLEREVKEETGLHIDCKDAEKILTIQNTTFYILQLPDQDISLSDEHTGYKEVDMKKPEDYNLTGKYKKAVEKAKELLDDRQDNKSTTA